MEAKSISTDMNVPAAIDCLSPTSSNDERAIIINSVDKKKKKTKGGGFNLLKAALFMLRNKPNEKPKRTPLPAVKVAKSNSKGTWKKLLGSIRPLHLQDNPIPSSPSASPPPQQVFPPSSPTSTTTEQFEDVVIAPASPASTSACTMSQYSSANNLVELDNHDEDSEDEDDVFDDKPADAMIDAKADEFIAHFYAQMRLQQLGSARGNY